MNDPTLGPETPELERAASDPATPATTLANIATTYPRLRLAIARNPAAYDELLTWLAQYGDAEVKAAVANRSPEPAGPTAPASAAAPSAPQVKAQAGKPLNTAALLALIFALGGGTLGIVFGHIARRQIRRTGEQGATLALVGLVLGYLVTALILVLFIAAVNLDLRLSSPSY